MVGHFHCFLCHIYQIHEEQKEYLQPLILNFVSGLKICKTKYIFTILSHEPRKHILFFMFFIVAFVSFITLKHRDQAENSPGI